MKSYQKLCGFGRLYKMPANDNLINVLEIALTALQRTFWTWIVK